MPVNQRQFDQLSEMGISLWQHKTPSFSDNKVTKDNIEQKALYIAHDSQSLTDLIKQTIFTDILQSIGISIGEITVHKDHLDLGVINWYFSANQHDTSTIYCEHSNLFSPNISLISQSVELKKQLWLTISNHLL